MRDLSPLHPFDHHWLTNTYNRRLVRKMSEKITIRDFILLQYDYNITDITRDGRVSDDFESGIVKMYSSHNHSLTTNNCCIILLYYIIYHVQLFL